MARDRHYGLEIGDKVRFRAFGIVSPVLEVVRFSPLDNNCAYVRYPDGREIKVVAEWCVIESPETSQNG